MKVLGVKLPDYVPPVALQLEFTEDELQVLISALAEQWCRVGLNSGATYVLLSEISNAKVLHFTEVA